MKFRTEDLRTDEIESLFVATEQDREVIEALKASNPLIIEGSRGTGKSFLLRIAELELNEAKVRGTRSEVGTRFAVNLGCLFALEATPASVALEIARNLSVKRFTEFGANHPAYSELTSGPVIAESIDIHALLQTQLSKPVDEIDIADHQCTELRRIGLQTIGDVLRASEDELIEKLEYVGPVRARRIKNEADAAILEYLSG